MEIELGRHSLEVVELMHEDHGVFVPIYGYNVHAPRFLVRRRAVGRFRVDTNLFPHSRPCLRARADSASY